VKYDENNLKRFFKNHQRNVIKVPSDQKEQVFIHAKRGTIYTSKQTSDIYKFENENFYISWQAKFGNTRPFGPANWCEEVQKAILHNPCKDIKFVLVIVAQTLAAFFTRLETSGRNFILIKDDDGKRLAVQFNPGYIMHVSRKTTRERKETSQKGRNTKRKSKKKEERRKSKIIRVRSPRRSSGDCAV